MLIQNITRYQSTDIRLKASKEKPKIDVVSREIPKDTYEPSPTDVRTDLIKTVQKRVSSGYYNSPEVLDDLSDAFAKVLNRTT